MSEVFTGNCPLCSAIASWQSWNGGIARIYNCPSCKVFAISSWVEKEIVMSFHRETIRSQLPGMQSKPGWAPYIRQGDGVSFLMEHVQS